MPGARDSINERCFPGMRAGGSGWKETSGMVGKLACGGRVPSSPYLQGSVPQKDHVFERSERILQEGKSVRVNKP